MKKILTIISALAVLAGCQSELILNTDFSLPDELSSPEAVSLDVTSTDNIVFSWKGGGASDGGVVLYNVLFDKEGGNFSEPVAVVKSDLGSHKQLTMTHSALNIIARKAGIAPSASGKLIWTVSASRGGNTKFLEKFSTINITRGEGIDNIPEKLYIQGAAALEAGQAFRVASEGVFVIYTQLGAGAIRFSSEKDGSGNKYFADASGKLAEGEGSYDVAAAPSTGLARVTVDLNTLGLKIEEIGKSVRTVWAATYADIAVLEYAGNGDFVGDGDVVFLGPGREGTPSWCSWVEERYYFIATVDGVETCWGSSFGGNSFTPDGNDSFFYIIENKWEQWNNCWKMDHAYDLAHVTYTIFTNKDNQMTHSYVGGAIQYEQPSKAPAVLKLSGEASEGNQDFRKVSEGVFQIVNRFSDGNITLADAEGTRYFADAEGKLFIGKKNTPVTASTGVTRLTVDFNAKTVRKEEISSEISLVWAATYFEVIKLAYQGLGKFAGEGDVLFLGPGREGTPSWCSWVEERYYFWLTVNGAEKKWGSAAGVDTGNRPDGEVPADFFNLSEYDRSQWDNAWKMASAIDESHVTVTINTNNMTHSFQIASSEPETPSIIPAGLTLAGTGAETEGQAFRKAGDGVFQIIAKLKDGKISFKSGSKNFFLDPAKGLLQSKGEMVSSASEGLASRITVNFNDLTVKVEKIENVRAAWGANNGGTIFELAYNGNGKFLGHGLVKFFQPGDFSWLSWVEERYYILVDVDGTTKIWGRLDGVTGEKPDGSANYYDFAEFNFSQWDHLWKFEDKYNGKDVRIEVDTNKDGVMVHSVGLNG